MQYINHYKSPIGGITLGSDGENIIGLWFDGEKYFGDTLNEQTEENKNAIIGIYNKSLTKKGEYNALIGIELY